MLSVPLISLLRARVWIEVVVLGVQSRRRRKRKTTATAVTLLRRTSAREGGEKRISELKWGRCFSPFRHDDGFQSGHASIEWGCTRARLHVSSLIFFPLFLFRGSGNKSHSGPNDVPRRKILISPFLRDGGGRFFTPFRRGRNYDTGRRRRRVVDKIAEDNAEL